MKRTRQKVLRLFMFWAFLWPGAVWAQNTFPASGNVGVGTNGPQASLSVNGNLRVEGSVSPTTGVGLEFAYASGMAYMSAYSRTNSAFIPITVGASDNYNVTSSSWRVRNALGADLLYVNATTGNPTSSNVGIGTTNPQHLLHVNGIIGAQEVIVSSTGADYVFDPGYRLKPLTEIAGYIRQHHHLPDIPPAGDAQTKGVNVGEMQTKLLAKIEELTLHMIEADERNNRLDQQNQELRERIARLEAGAR